MEVQELAELMEIGMGKYSRMERVLRGWDRRRQKKRKKMKPEFGKGESVKNLIEGRNSGVMILIQDETGWEKSERTQRAG